jgi:hypothetical protein
MKSRISIDVDWDNQPIIKIEYADSEDVRDKLVKRFLQAFGSESCWANFCYSDIYHPTQINNLATIRPVPMNVYKLEEQLKMLQDTIEKVKNDPVPHVSAVE